MGNNWVEYNYVNQHLGIILAIKINEAVKLHQDSYSR